MESQVISDTSSGPVRIKSRTGLRGLLDRIIATPEGGILIAFILIQIGCIVAALIFPDSFRYLSPQNIAVMQKAIPTLGILAIGVGLLMIAGEFDLSVGSIYIFTSIVAALLMQAGLTVWIAVPLMVIAGGAISVLNGLITLRFALPSFIVSLGAMLFWKGMVFFVHGATSIKFGAPDSFTRFVSGEIGMVQISFIWMIVLTIVFQVLLRYHRFGNHIYATGGDRNAALANGVNPDRVKLICFGLAGMCAAFSGMVSAARVGSMTPAAGGGLELQAIAAAVIGGVALTGGRGSMIGVFLGSCLIYTIQDVLLLMRAPGFYLDIFVGALIVLAAIANNVIAGKGAR